MAIFSPGRTTNRSPTQESLDRDPHFATAPQHRDVLGAQVQQRAQRRTGAPLGAGLEVAPGEDEHGDRGGDLEVDLVLAPAARGGEDERASSCPACRRRRRTARTATSRTRPACRGEISVSIVAAPWRRLVQAARWNGQAPHTTTGAARVSDSHCQLSNCSGGTIASSEHRDGQGRARSAVAGAASATSAVLDRLGPVGSPVPPDRARRRAAAAV